MQDPLTTIFTLCRADLPGHALPFLAYPLHKIKIINYLSHLSSRQLKYDL